MAGNSIIYLYLLLFQAGYELNIILVFTGSVFLVPITLSQKKKKI